MARIISIHSFRGGTGKSNTTANLAALLAAEGRRVGVVDVRCGDQATRLDLKLSGGQALLPITGEVCQLEIQLQREP